MWFVEQCKPNGVVMSESKIGLVWDCGKFNFTKLSGCLSIG